MYSQPKDQANFLKIIPPKIANSYLMNQQQKKTSVPKATPTAKASPVLNVKVEKHFQQQQLNGYPSPIRKNFDIESIIGPTSSGYAMSLQEGMTDPAQIAMKLAYYGIMPAQDYLTPMSTPTGFGAKTGMMSGKNQTQISSPTLSASSGSSATSQSEQLDKFSQFYLNSLTCTR